MTRISRGFPIPKQIERAELSDFVIAVGHAKEEIFPPYQNPHHERAGKEIIAHLEKRKYQGFEGFISDPKLFYSGITDPPERLEVVGGLTGWCVWMAVTELLENDHIVHVNPHRIFGSKPLSPYWEGRILLRTVLNEVPSAYCHIYKGDFMFYRK